MLSREKIIITGVVQGVGFRPFVYKVAQEMGIRGFVLNSSHGIIIDAEGTNLDDFIETILKKAPPLSRIKEIIRHSLPPASYDNFRIQESETREDCYTLISPDVATCKDCLGELFDVSNRRFLYSFINCTRCGPRYTIVTDVPYDRPKTTMAGFTMCPECNLDGLVKSQHHPSTGSGRTV